MNEETMTEEAEKQEAKPEQNISFKTNFDPIPSTSKVTDAIREAMNFGLQEATVEGLTEDEIEQLQGSKYSVNKAGKGFKITW